MNKLYKLLLICLLIIAGGGNALKAQSYNSDNSETANRTETPTYISKIAVAYGEKESTPKDILNKEGFTIIDYDLNKGCGATSHYIYMGYKTTTNPANAITGIFFRTGNNPPNYDTFDGVTAYLLGGSDETNPGEDKAVDLNAKAGGQYIYTYVTRNTSRAAVLNGMYFNGSNSASGYVTPDVNLNSGTKGDAIYLHYKQFSGKASATFHYLNSNGSRTSSTTSVSVKHHQQAVNNTPSAPTSVTYDGRTWTLLGWREDNNATTAGSNPSYTYMDSKVYRAVYSADVSLTYNANGGSNAPSKQTAKQYVNAGSSSIAKSNTSFTTPSTTPTHDATKCNFAGWSTSSSSTTAQYQAGGSISINTNTTLYAVWPEHNGTKTYVNNGSNHTYTWSCCEKSVTEDHIYDNGIDNYCGAHIHEIDGNGYCHLCDGYPAELVNGYYEIYNADNLFWFAEYVNTIDRTASAKLMNDIDLENRPWTPIGTTGESSHNFRGHFDGNGKTITGLNVEVTRSGGGFFGEVRLGTVEDFTIYGEVKLNGNHSYVGGVIGSAPGANSNQPEHNGATIRNITSYVNVTLGEGSHGSNRVAGFIGYANHETLIENCTWYGTLDLGPYRAQDGVGGLVGKANDNSEITIRNCAAYGTIKTSYQSGSYNSHNSIYIGGIVSNSVESAQTTLENCIWAGTLVNNTNLGSNAHISAIGTLDGIKSVSNCYALDNMPYITTNNAHNEGITEVTAEQLASGEIAYKLQGTQATQIWGQNIDNGETADSKPRIGGAKVYGIIYDGGGIYSNTNITAGGKCGNNLYWKVSDNTLTIFGTGAMYDYGNISNIAPWRSLNPAPKSLVLEDGITHIGKFAFYNYYGFTGDLTIPNSVTTIGDYAFENCSSFNGSLTIPNSVKSIGNAAFYECSGFTGSLTIPNSVTSIGKYAFMNCSGFNGSLTIGNSVTSIGISAFELCSGFTGSLTIGNSVKSIGDYAFYKCTGFTEVYSFAVTAPTLGHAAFSFDTNSNATLYYPVSSEQSYNNNGWFNYFSKRMGFNGKCGDNLYWYVDDENTLTIFGTGAMDDYDSSSNKAPWCSLNPAPTSLVLDEDITHIGNYAFYGCSSFTGSLTIPNSVTSIGNAAFQNCFGFTGSLTIPNSVTSIGDYAFQNCSGFTEVHSLAETAPTLGQYVFDMPNNAILYYPASSKQSYNDNSWFNYFLQHKAFNGKCGDNLYWNIDDEKNLTIFGTGAMYDYGSSNKAPWRSLIPAPKSLVLEEGISHIGNSAFEECYSFEGSLTIPNSVTSIGAWAFYQCDGFEGSLTIPNSVTSIGRSAFRECYGFNGSLTIGNSVTTIVNSAFEDCVGFTGSLTIPNSVTTIGNYAFQNCSGFTGSLTIGNSVTNIGNEAFYNCSGFTEVYSLAKTAPTLQTRAFTGTNSNATLYYPVSSEQSYNDNGWFEYFPQHIGFNGKCGDNLYWRVNDNILTIFGTGAMEDYDNIDNKAPWRSLNPAPTSLVLEEGITYIGNSAFYDCEGFTEVYSFAETAPTLGENAFKNINENATLYYPVSSKQSYNDNGWFEYFPQHIGFNGKCGDNLYWYVDDENTLTIFGTGAMYDYGSSNKAPWRSLNPAPTSLVLEEGITSIGNYAFYLCSGFKGSLTIPNSVTNIGNYAFYDCEGFKGSLTIPNSVTSIGERAFRNCSGFNGSLTIGNSVTTIGDYAFYECLGFNGSLTIPNSVTSIGNYAFQYCSNFTGSLTIGNSVTSIGNSAFYDCEGFTEVYSFAETAPTLGTDAFANINENATLYYPSLSEQSYEAEGWFNYFSKRIGYDNDKKCGDNLYWYVDDENTLTIFGTGAMYDYNYYGSNISPWKNLGTAPTSLLLEEGVTHIGNYAFYECSGFTGSLTIPNSVTTIGNYAFYECSGFTGSLTIPNSVTSIGNSAFFQCSGFTGSLTIPNSVTTIGDWAFYQCSGFTGDLTIPNSVTTIGNRAFYYCSGFTGSLTIPNSVTSIGEYAFYQCSGFTGSLTIPNSVTSIGNSAFYYCEGFTGSLTIPNSVTTIGDDAFRNCSGFNGSLTIGNSVTTIGDYAFYNCVGFTGSLTIGNSVTTIGDRAFYYCSGFTGSLTIPNSVTSIGEYAFDHCSGFDGSLTIPNSVTTIGNSAFRNCSGFTGDLTIPNSVTTIGDYAFYECLGFNGSLTIPNSVTSIGNYAFSSCSGFSGNLTIPNSVKSIGSSAFSGCSSFTGSLTIGNSVTTIGYDAFAYCSGFTGSLTIPNSVTSIGNSAFFGCRGFTGSLTIPNSVTSIGNEAFYDCDNFTEIFFYRDTNPTIGTSAFSDINAKVCVPVIWESFDNIPEDKLVKMATFVGEQSAVSGQQSGWVLPEGMTEVSADDHVAINAPMVISGQQSANSLSVKSFGLCGNGTTVNGSITIEDGGQLYCEIANGEVTVKKEILGYQQSESESKWYTIASPLKDTIQTIPNSSFLTSNSDLYRYDEPSYTWQNAKNSANNGFNTIDPGRGYLYANAENTTLEFKGNINTETVTYNLTAKSDVLNGFHLIGNPFTHDIYLGESIKTKETQNIIFELNDSYGDGWNGNALNISFSDGTPDKIITIESGNSKTETINVASGVTVTVSFTIGNYPGECSFTIKNDDGEIICGEYSSEGSLDVENVENIEPLTTFTVKEGIDVLVNGYYTLTGEGAWAAEASTTEAIKPMQGILVKSLVDDYELSIFNISRQLSAVSRQQSRNRQETTDNGQQSLCISVSNAKYSDRAFVVFDKGVGLDKMNHENEDIPLLYIPMEDADYAIAMMDMNVNEIPVNFETNVMGEYTISLRQENCEFDELYLLDKETDEKVNILEQDYTFIATSSENPERFVLMKDAQGSQLEAHSHFAYINNGDIVIYDIEGDADIKIFDALGRCVYQGESSDETTRIANGYSAGVYMIQKVDDNGVKVQKVMID